MGTSVDRSQIFKICGRLEWEAACKQGVFAGAPIDLQDGFIHFSARHQVAETLAKHFAGQPDLVLVGFASEAFGTDLKWEVSRNGDEFPHLYAELPTTTAESVVPLELVDGVHALPADFS